MEIFTLNSNELELRLDCFFYKPEFRKLEKNIKKISNNELKNYVNNIAGGATPKKTRRSYYADKNTGIPFLRVQNVKEYISVNIQNRNSHVKNVEKKIIFIKNKNK